MCQGAWCLNIKVQSIALTLPSHLIATSCSGHASIYFFFKELIKRKKKYKNQKHLQLHVYSTKRLTLS